MAAVAAGRNSDGRGEHMVESSATSGTIATLRPQSIQIPGALAGSVQVDHQKAATQLPPGPEEILAGTTHSAPSLDFELARHASPGNSSSVPERSFPFPMAVEISQNNANAAGVAFNPEASALHSGAIPTGAPGTDALPADVMPEGGPPRESPAHLNCTAKGFIDRILSAVVAHLNLAGVESEPDFELSYHLDTGRSQPEGGGRKIPGPVTNIDTAKVDTIAGPNCTQEQLLRCSHGIGDLASLEGLSEYLTKSLQHGVADPSPNGSYKFGWGSVAESAVGRQGVDVGVEIRPESLVHSNTQARRLKESNDARLSMDAKSDVRPSSSAKPAMQLGGGSGAGFQIVCDGRNIATAGGGGGGGLRGKFGHGLTLHDVLKDDATLGGGSGGGSQIFWPSKAIDPWTALEWESWTSGGGSGCGSCKVTDEKCKESRTGIFCGAKFDDDAATDADLAQPIVARWRKQSLRRCFEAGKLVIVGGGGGSAGGSECCKAIPSLNFAFGFHAKMKPTDRDKTKNRTVMDSPTVIAYQDKCCPDLRRWNITMAGVSNSGGSSVRIVANNAKLPKSRRLGTKPLDGGSQITGAEEFLNNPQMMQTDFDANQNSDQQLSKCTRPSWLQGTEAEVEEARKATRTKTKTVATKEPESVLQYIYKFNPVHLYLNNGANACGSWGQWCCLCHHAQRQIACLPPAEREQLDFFIKKDCCESRLPSSAGGEREVTVVTPIRNSTMSWTPGSGWAELPEGASDSYQWPPSEFGPARRCAMMDVGHTPSSNITFVDPLKSTQWLTANFSGEFPMATSMFLSLFVVFASLVVAVISSRNRVLATEVGRHQRQHLLAGNEQEEPALIAGFPDVELLEGNSPNHNGWEYNELQ